MNTSTTFFATRTAARNATSANAKFKDFGKDAPKGERWATVSTVAAPSAKPTLMKAATSAPKAKTPRTNSKKTAALEILRNLAAKGELNRQEALAELQATTSMSAPCASTYFANFKNGTWS